VVDNPDADPIDQGTKGQNPPSVENSTPRISEKPGSFTKKIRIFAHQGYVTNLADGFQPICLRVLHFP
jgi:hypothetical protein